MLVNFCILCVTKLQTLQIPLLLGTDIRINLLSNGTAQFGGEIVAFNADTGAAIVGAGIVTVRRASTSHNWVGYETGNDVGTSFFADSGRMGLGGEPFDDSVFQLTGTCCR